LKQQFIPQELQASLLSGPPVIMELQVALFIYVPASTLGSPHHRPSHHHLLMQVFAHFFAKGPFRHRVPT
jgi:hypothetical protein